MCLWPRQLRRPLKFCAQPRFQQLVVFISILIGTFLLFYGTLPPPVVGVHSSASATPSPPHACSIYKTHMLISHGDTVLPLKRQFVPPEAFIITAVDVCFCSILLDEEGHIKLTGESPAVPAPYFSLLIFMDFILNEPNFLLTMSDCVFRFRFV